MSGLVQPELLPHLLDVSRRRREITDKRLYRVTGHNGTIIKLMIRIARTIGIAQAKPHQQDSDPSSRPFPHRLCLEGV